MGFSKRLGWENEVEPQSSGQLPDSSYARDMAHEVFLAEGHAPVVLAKARPGCLSVQSREGVCRRDPILSQLVPPLRNLTHARTFWLANTRAEPFFRRRPSATKAACNPVGSSNSLAVRLMLQHAPCLVTREQRQRMFQTNLDMDQPETTWLDFGPPPPPAKSTFCGQEKRTPTRERRGKSLAMIRHSQERALSIMMFFRAHRLILPSSMQSMFAEKKPFCKAKMGNL